MTEWLDIEDTWVKEVVDADRIAVGIKILAEHAPTDENGGDHTETHDDLLWLLSRGTQGRSWGITGYIAEEMGLWS